LTIFWIKSGLIRGQFNQLPIDPSFIPSFFTIVAFSADLIGHDFDIPRKLVQRTYLRFPIFIKKIPFGTVTIFWGAKIFWNPTFGNP